jgi:hypothetical protein
MVPREVAGRFLCLGLDEEADCGWSHRCWCLRALFPCCRRRQSNFLFPRNLWSDVPDQMMAASTSHSLLEGGMYRSYCLNRSGILRQEIIVGLLLNAYNAKLYLFNWLTFWWKYINFNLLGYHYGYLYLYTWTFICFMTTYTTRIELEEPWQRTGIQLVFTIGFELVVKSPTRHTSCKWQKYPYTLTIIRGYNHSASL